MTLQALITLVLGFIPFAVVYYGSFVGMNASSHILA
jgi:hypothetical protein